MTGVGQMVAVVTGVGEGSLGEATAAALRERGYRRIALSSYFTAPGDFARLAAADAPWLVAAPLGAQEAMAALLLDRYDAAVAARTGPAVAAAV